MLLEAIPHADRGKDSASGGWVRTHLVGCCFVIFFFKLLLKIKGGRCCLFVGFFGLVSFFSPCCYEKEKRKKKRKRKERESICGRERRKSPRKESFGLYPRIWLPGPTGMSSHKFSTAPCAESIIKQWEGALGSQGGGARGCSSEARLSSRNE